MEAGRAEKHTLRAAFVAFSIVAMLFLPAIAQLELISDKQIKEAVTVTRYTPYCDECYFCIQSNDTILKHDLKLNEITYKTEDYKSKIEYKDLKIDYYKSGASFCWHWTRDRANVIDIIPTILGFEQRQWATWTPTKYEVNTPANGSILSGTTYFEVNGTATGSYKMEWRAEYPNGTLITSYADMIGHIIIDLDGDNDAQFGIGWCEIVYDNAQVKIPADWDTSNYDAGDGLWDYDVHSAYANSAYYSDDSWVKGSGEAAGIGNWTCQNSTIPDGDYYVWNANDGNYFNISLSSSSFNTGQGNAGYPVLISNTDTTTAANGNFSVEMFDHTSGWETMNVLLLHTDNDLGNWSIGIDTTTLPDGQLVVFRFNFYNMTSGFNNDSLTLNVTILQAPTVPTCNAASITASHWLYNLTKYINTDAALSLSGCIQETQWDNGTTFNDSWDVGASNWFNITNDDVLQFYGTHYLIFYCNDSNNQWVTCAQDSYDVSEGGGLTSTQETQLERLYYCDFAGCDWFLYANHDYCLDNQTLHTEIEQYTCIGSDCFWKNDSYDTKCVFSCVNSSYDSGYCIDSVTDLLFGSQIGFYFLLILVAVVVLYIFYRMVV